MTTSSALLAARAAAARRMQDTCRISAPDPDSRDRRVVYEGPCRVSMGDQDGGGSDLRDVQPHRAKVHLPIHESVAVSVGHLITITKAAHDPALVGTYIVTAHHTTSAASARRLTCRRVS